MTAVGVVCEYNPFHLGHLRQFRAIRERFGQDAAVVCAMSGNYVQRGEPALFDKFTRARAAALCGADLVLELPLTGCFSSAEGFAAAGIELLDALGCVDAVCFGSERGDVGAAERAAELLLRPEFDGVLRDELAAGVSYAAARERALARLGGDGTLLERPNDILAVEYCKALRRLGSAMEPFAVARGGDYHAPLPDAENPSATSLRARVLAGEDWAAYVPAEAAAVFRDAPRYSLAAGERAVLARLRTLSDAEFAALPYGSEGLWSRFRRACREEADLEGVIAAAKSKRYARARLMRMTMCACLGLSAETLRREPPFARVLAFDDAGRALLRRAKNAGRVRLLNAGVPAPDREWRELERRADGFYALFRADGAAACGLESSGRVFYRI